MHGRFSFRVALIVAAASAEALTLSARRNFDVTEANAALVQDRMQLGTASDLDYQRALAEVAKGELVNSRRDLESLSRLTSKPAVQADLALALGASRTLLATPVIYSVFDDIAARFRKRPIDPAVSVAGTT